VGSVLLSETKGAHWPAVGWRRGHQGRLFQTGTTRVATAFSWLALTRILPMRPNGGLIHKFLPCQSCEKAYVPAPPGVGLRLQNTGSKLLRADANVSTLCGPQSCSKAANSLGFSCQSSESGNLDSSSACLFHSLGIHSTTNSIYSVWHRVNNCLAIVANEGIADPFCCTLGTF
jgi:hypothetical protein